MSGREVIAVVAVLAALAVAVGGVVGLATGRGLTLEQRSMRAATSPQQRHYALGVIRAGGAPAPSDQGLVVLVATGLASYGWLAWTSAGLALTCLSFAVGRSSTPVVVVAAAVAAVINAVAAVMAAVRWRRGCRWLADHPEPGRAVGVRR